MTLELSFGYSVGFSRTGRTRCLQEKNLSVWFLQIPASVQTEKWKNKVPHSSEASALFLPAVASDLQPLANLR